MQRKKYVGAAVVAGVLGSLAMAGRAEGAVGTILLVVANSANLDTQELARKALMEGWGYTVTPISDDASTGTYDTTVLTVSCAYVCESVSASTLGTKLRVRTIPVLFEENDQVDDMRVATGSSTFSATAIDITNTSHYITSTFSLGSKTILSTSATLVRTTGTASGMTTLAEQLSSSNPMLIVCERGATLTSGTAAGRRVFLPWGGSVLTVSNLTADGLTIMQRSIEWCLMPVAWYKLDDASGNTAVDSAGGYNGTRSGATWTTGKFAGGLSFDGSNDYVSISNAAAFQVTGALTIAGWVKSTAAWNTGSTVATILRKGDSNPNNWQLSITNGRVELTLDQGDNAGVNGNTTLSLNTWHHVAGTWDGASVRIYLNGVLDNTPTSRAAPIGTDTRAVYLGGRTGSTDVINGVEDDVRFYNRCLTAAEIAALAASGKPKILSWENVDPGSP